MLIEAYRGGGGREIGRRGKGRNVEGAAKVVVVGSDSEATETEAWPWRGREKNCGEESKTMQRGRGSKAY